MKTYRKNSRRNPWRNTRKRREIPIEKILAWLLIISIPLMIICLTANLVMRLSDTYQYNLRATQSVSQTGRMISEEKLIDLFGDFMMGETDDFVLMEDVEYQPENVFNDKDQKVMTNLRDALDIILVVGLISFFVTALVYFFLIRWRKKEIHLQNYKRSIWSFVILTIINSMIKLVPALRDATWGRVFGTDFPKRNVLIQILEKSFALHVTIFDIIISTVLMAILGYVTWQVAGRKKIFKRF